MAQVARKSSSWAARAALALTVLMSSRNRVYPRVLIGGWSDGCRRWPGSGLSTVDTPAGPGGAR